MSCLCCSWQLWSVFPRIRSNSPDWRVLFIWCREITLPNARVIPVHVLRTVLLYGTCAPRIGTAPRLGVGGHGEKQVSRSPGRQQFLQTTTFRRNTAWCRLAKDSAHWRRLLITAVNLEVCKRRCCLRETNFTWLLKDVVEYFANLTMTDEFRNEGSYIGHPFFRISDYEWSGLLLVTTSQ